MPETTVEPRIKQRIVDVAMQCDRDFVTRWEGLVNALKSAINILDQAPSPEKQGHLVPLIETSRWALGEFEAMTYGGASRDRAPQRHLYTAAERFPEPPGCIADLTHRSEANRTAEQSNNSVGHWVMV